MSCMTDNTLTIQRYILHNSPRSILVVMVDIFAGVKVLSLTYSDGDKWIIINAINEIMSCWSSGWLPAIGYQQIVTEKSANE